MSTLRWTSTLPANLKAGKYLMRHELIARHQANNPQFYADCAQLEVSGSGTASPDSSYKVAIPSTTYADSSNNMLNFEVNGFSMPASEYVNTGPKVWGGSGSPSGGGSSPTTTRQSSQQQSSTRAQTTCQASNQYYSEWL
ncbi:hypothetical protein HDV00_011405 [Rhizophlyctis rosea]|nr:hypothetical protein HDV00_011405 [Rhizophlyctis rosea]